MEMKPTSGRMVRYRFMGEEIPAVIQKVHPETYDDGDCELYVMWPMKFSAKYPQVPFAKYSEEAIDETWGWPKIVR